MTILIVVIQQLIKTNELKVIYFFWNRVTTTGCYIDSLGRQPENDISTRHNARDKRTTEKRDNLFELCEIFTHGLQNKDCKNLALMVNTEYSLL